MRFRDPKSWGAAFGAGILASVALLPQARGELVLETDTAADSPQTSQPAQTETVREVIGYCDRNRGRMRYDEYLAAGYPIGSGVAEGACRHLVKDRMEQTGMRWTVEGAQAMPHVRALYLNDQWEGFHEHRVEQEQARLYRRPAA